MKNSSRRGSAPLSIFTAPFSPAKLSQLKLLDFRKPVILETHRYASRTCGGAPSWASFRGHSLLRRSGKSSFPNFRSSFAKWNLLERLYPERKEFNFKSHDLAINATQWWSNWSHFSLYCLSCFVVGRVSILVSSFWPIIYMVVCIV